jgi:hypothetical protein
MGESEQRPANLLYFWVRPAKREKLRGPGEQISLARIIMHQLSWQCKATVCQPEKTPGHLFATCPTISGRLSRPETQPGETA